MFRAVPLSISRSLFAVHSAMVCVIQVWEIGASGWFYYKERAVIHYQKNKMDMQGNVLWLMSNIYVER
jgi:hypothetical protein